MKARSPGLAVDGGEVARGHQPRAVGGDRDSHDPGLVGRVDHAGDRDVDGAEVFARRRDPSPSDASSKLPAAMRAPLASLISDTVRMPVGAKVGSIRSLTRSYLASPRRVIPLTCEKAPEMNKAVSSSDASIPVTTPSNDRLSGDMTPVSLSKATKFCRE